LVLEICASLELGSWNLGDFSAALHGRHDRNLVSWFERVIAIYKFHARADQNAFSCGRSAGKRA
jgi:hypothetical protein